jgi:hypothetical protein
MVDVVYELDSRDGRVLIRSAVSALLWGGSIGQSWDY